MSKNVIYEREISTKHIRSPGFRDMRVEVTLQRVAVHGG